MKFKAKRMSVQVGWTGLLNEPEAPAGPFEWTPIPLADPSDDQYYVDTALGSNSNDGSEAHPFATFAYALTQITPNSGDRIYLKCGQSFTGTMNAWQKTGVSASRPIIITSYGTGDRPIIDFTTNTYFFQPDWGGAWTINHIWFVGLEIKSSSYLGTAFKGAFRFNWANTGLLIEDCYIHGLTQGLETNGATYGRVSNVRVRGNTFADMYYSDATSNPGCHGAYNDDVDGLTFENNLFIDCGWLSTDETYAQTFNHAIYIHAGGTGTDGGGCTSVVCKDNLVFGGDGITCRPGGIVTGNVCVQSLSGVQVGMGDLAQVGGITVTMEDNIAIEIKGFLSSIATSSAIGYAIGNIGGASTFSNNICANASLGTSSLPPRGFWFRTPDNLGPSGLVVGAPLTFSGNIFYKFGEFWGQSLPAASYTATTTMSGNDFQMERSLGATQVFYMNSAGQMSHFTWSGNNYFETASAGNQWFTLSGAGQTYAQWVTTTADASATSIDNSSVYPDPNRNLGDWYLSVGGTDDQTAAVAYLRTRSRASNWVSVVDIAAYLRAGFGL